MQVNHLDLMWWILQIDFLFVNPSEMSTEVHDVNVEMKMMNMRSQKKIVAMLEELKVPEQVLKLLM